MTSSRTSSPFSCPQQLVCCAILILGIFLNSWCAQAANPQEDLSKGQFADDFKLIDHRGNSHQLTYYSDRKAVVLITHGNGCPINRKAISDLNSFYQEYSARGVVFLMINANVQDDRASIAKEAEDFNIPFPILEDRSQLVSESLQLTRTAEVLVIDPKDWRIVYRGPVNDRLNYETQKKKAGEHFLKDVLDQILEGKIVKPISVPVKGCLISYEEDPKQIFSYARDVAPILIKSCLPCHTPGGVAPWNMDNYRRIKGWSTMIREVVRIGRMPPWQGDPNYGKFTNDISLTPQEMRTLVHWIEQGSMQGEGDDPLLRASQPQTNQWALGQPDRVFVFSQEQQIPATGVIPYQVVAADNTIDEDIWVRAVDLQPGNRKVVHHCDVAVVLPNESAAYDPKLSDWSKRSGMTVDGVGQIVAGYAPGYDSLLVLPEGTGLFLPKGAKLNFWMHYITTGKDERDITRFGLYLYKGKPPRVYSVVHLSNRNIEIAAGEREFRISASHVFDEDVVVASLTPHMHYRGKSMRLTAHYPDGSQEVLLSVPDFKFNWQRRYILAKPKGLPAKTRIVADGVFDNSAQNPDNPDPSKIVRFGSQSDDEMFSAFVAYTTENK